MFRAHKIELISCFIVFAVMFVLNSFCPYLSDDWHFSFVWKEMYPTGDDIRVHSFEDVVVSMQNFYNMCGGRVFPHFVIYCILMLPKWCFDIANSIMYVLLCVFMYLLFVMISGRKKPAVLPLMAIFPYLFLGSFGSNVFWISGAVNYLWSDVLLLGSLCMIVYVAKIGDKGVAKYVISLIPVFLSAFTNEITGGIIVVTVVLMCICRRISIRKLLGYILAVLPGIIIVVGAPGNRARYIMAEGAENIENFSSFSHLLRYAIPVYCEILLSKYSFVLFLTLFCFILELEIGRDLFDVLKAYMLCIAGVCGILALSFSHVRTPSPLLFGVNLITVTMLVAVVRLKGLMTERKCRIGQTEMIRACLDFLAVFMTMLTIAYSQNLAVFITGIVVITAVLTIRIFVIGKYAAEDVYDFDALVKKFRRLTGKPVLVLICSLIFFKFAYSCFCYYNWLGDVHSYYVGVIELLKNDEYDKAQDLPFLGGTLNNLTPNETSLADHKFLVGWMNQYYLAEGDKIYDVI